MFLGLSGGKDSAALAIHMDKNIQIFQLSIFLPIQVMSFKKLTIF